MAQLQTTELWNIFQIFLQIKLYTYTISFFNSILGIGSVHFLSLFHLTIIFSTCFLHEINAIIVNCIWAEKKSYFVQKKIVFVLELFTQKFQTGIKDKFESPNFVLFNYGKKWKNVINVWENVVWEKTFFQFWNFYMD